MSLPPVHALLPVLFTESACLQYLLGSGCFYAVLPCPTCGDEMPANVATRRYRCSRRSCETVMSVRSHTFFSASRLQCCKILQLGYHWLNKNGQRQVINATGCSKQTITTFFAHFRSLVATTLDDEDTIIGGLNIEVEVDETKLGKRKYNRGHRVDGVWILVGVEKSDTRRVFMKKIQDRSAATLEEIILQHVAPGSIVITDLWKGYSQIERNLGFIHRTVNHSKHFKDPISGVNTNTVEGTNSGLKMHIRPRNRTQGVDSYLTEIIWRRKNADRLWEAFISALRDVHYDLQ
jgi:hypothetical protein